MTGSTTEGPPIFTLVSTFTDDHIPLADGSVRVQRGGPAHYMGLALTDMNVRFRLITGPSAPVDVIPGPEGERYIIPRLNPIPLGDSLGGDAVILSPVMREILPESVPDVRGLLAIDLQGFVRRPGDPAGGLDCEVDLASLLRRTHVVKASEPELAALTPGSRNAMAEAIVLVTRGEHGATIRRPGGEDIIEARPVPAPNTIGAGDTFLSAFIVAILAGRTPRHAGERAARFTETMLRRRMCG